MGDLVCITFTLSGTLYDVWTSQAVDFQSFIAQFSTTSNVDTKRWDVFERLDFMNDLHAFCVKNSFPFPFQVNPPVETDEQGDVVKKEEK